MNNVVFRRSAGALLKAFVRSQWIAAPVGLALAGMECIAPDRAGLGFPTAATAAWYIATPVSMLIWLAIDT